MLRVRHCGAVVRLVSLTILTYSALAGASADSTTDTSPSFALKPEERSTLEPQALAGDPEAAVKLLEHYSLPRSGLPETESLAEQRYWATIAAENGDIPSMNVLGRILHLGRNQRDCRRGTFWLRRELALTLPTLKKKAGQSAPDWIAKAIEAREAQCLSRAAGRAK
jgi:hypothetical protein